MSRAYRLRVLRAMARRALESPGIHHTDQKTGQTFYDQLFAALYPKRRR